MSGKAGLLLLLRALAPLSPRARTPDPLTQLPRRARLLVSRPDHIGDLLMALPALARLRARLPEAHITLLVASWAQPLVAHTPLADQVLVLDPPWWTQKHGGRRPWGQRLREWGTLLRQTLALRRQRFDLALELRGDLRFIGLFGLLAAPRWFATNVRHGGGFLAHLAVPLVETDHEIDQNHALVDHLLAACGKVALPAPTGSHAPDAPGVPVARPLQWRPAQDQKVTERLQAAGLSANQRFVVVHPGGKWVNRWPLDRFVALCQWLRQAHPALAIVVTGGPQDLAMAQALVVAAPGVHSLAGQLSMMETAALIARARVYVGADTGPMHLLNFLQVPSVLLFGPTQPERFAPRTDGACLLRGGPCCREDLHEVCERAAPDQPSACMQQIDLASVQAALSAHIATPPPALASGPAH